MSLPALLYAAILILVLVVSTQSQDQPGDFSGYRQELRRNLEPLFKKAGGVIDLEEKIRNLRPQSLSSGADNDESQPMFRSASADPLATFQSAGEAPPTGKKLNEPFFRSLFEKGMYSLVGSQQDPNRKQPRLGEKRLVRLLTDFLNVPRFYQGIKTNTWSKNLLKEFFKYGLDAFIQDPMESLQWAADTGRMFTYAPIANVIAYIPGKNVGTTKDKIIAITGHYDTHPNRTGLNDNASGIAVMLEIARTLIDAECEFDHTVMFVQLDQEEIGLLGSAYFVERFLIPKIKAERATFQGAFNLDTIMNYNSAPHSQRIPDGIKKFAPELAEKIKQKNFKGDFMLIQGRRGVDDRLGQALVNNWRKLEKPKFKMYYLSAPEEKTSKEEFEELFKRGDHWSFWRPDPRIYNGTISAVEVADTVDDRGIMKTCYHQMCDDDIHMMNPKNVYFIKKLGDAMIGALLDLGKGKCNKGQTLKEMIQKRKKILAAKAPPVDTGVYTLSASLTDEEPSSTPEPELEAFDFPLEIEPVRKTKKVKILDDKIEKALLSSLKIKNRAGWKEDARTLLPEFRSRMQFLSDYRTGGGHGGHTHVHSLVNSEANKMVEDAHAHVHRSLFGGSGKTNEVEPHFHSLRSMKQREPKAVEPTFHSARNSKYRSRDDDAEEENSGLTEEPERNRRLNAGQSQSESLQDSQDDMNPKIFIDSYKNALSSQFSADASEEITKNDFPNVKIDSTKNFLNSYSRFNLPSLNANDEEGDFIENLSTSTSFESPLIGDYFSDDDDSFISKNSGISSEPDTSPIFNLLAPYTEFREVDEDNLPTITPLKLPPIAPDFNDDSISSKVDTSLFNLLAPYTEFGEDGEAIFPTLTSLKLPHISPNFNDDFTSSKIDTSSLFNLLEPSTEFGEVDEDNLSTITSLKLPPIAPDFNDDDSISSDVNISSLLKLFAPYMEFGEDGEAIFPALTSLKLPHIAPDFNVDNSLSSEVDTSSRFNSFAPYTEFREADEDNLPTLTSVKLPPIAPDSNDDDSSAPDASSLFNLIGHNSDFGENIEESLPTVTSLNLPHIAADFNDDDSSIFEISGISSAPDDSSLFNLIAHNSGFGKDNGNVTSSSSTSDFLQHMLSEDLSDPIQNAETSDQESLDFSEDNLRDEENIPTVTSLNLTPIAPDFNDDDSSIFETYGISSASDDSSLLNLIAHNSGFGKDNENVTSSFSTSDFLQHMLSEDFSDPRQNTETSEQESIDFGEDNLRDEESLPTVTSLNLPPIAPDFNGDDSSIFETYGISSAPDDSSLFNLIAHNSGFGKYNENVTSSFSTSDFLQHMLSDLSDPIQNTETSEQENIDFGEDTSQDFPILSSPAFEKNDEPFQSSSIKPKNVFSSLPNLQFPTLKTSSADDHSNDISENSYITRPTASNDVFSSSSSNVNPDEFSSPNPIFDFPMNNTILEKYFSTFSKSSFPSTDFTFGKSKFARNKRQFDVKLYQYPYYLQYPTESYMNLYDNDIPYPKPSIPFRTNLDIHVDGQNYPEPSLDPLYDAPTYYDAPYFNNYNAMDEPLMYPEKIVDANNLDYFSQPMASMNNFESELSNIIQPDFMPDPLGPPKTFYPNYYIDYPETDFAPEFNNDNQYFSDASQENNFLQNVFAEPYFMSAKSGKNVGKRKKPRKGKKRLKKKKKSNKNKEENDHFIQQLSGILSTKSKNKKDAEDENEDEPSWKQSAKKNMKRKPSAKKKSTKKSKFTGKKRNDKSSEPQKYSRGGKKNATRVRIHAKGDKAFKEIVNAFKDDLLPKNSKLPKNFELSVEVKSKPEEKKDNGKRQSYFKKTVRKSDADDLNAQSQSSTEESSHFESSSSSNGNAFDDKGSRKEDMKFDDDMKMGSDFGMDDDAGFSSVDKSDDWSDDFDFMQFQGKKKGAEPVIMSVDEPRKKKKGKKKTKYVLIKKPPERFTDEAEVPEDLPNWMKMITEEADKYLAKKVEAESKPSWMAKMQEDADEYLKSRQKSPKKPKRKKKVKKKWMKKVDDDDDDDDAVARLPSWMKTMTDYADKYLETSPRWVKKLKVRPQKKKPKRRKQVKKKQRFNTEDQRMFDELRNKLLPGWSDEEPNWNEQPKVNELSENFWLNKMKSELNRRQHFGREDEMPALWPMNEPQWPLNDEENNLSDSMETPTGGSSDFDMDMDFDNFNSKLF